MREAPRLLLVEDDADQRALLSAVLTRGGYHVTTVARSREAAELVRASRRNGRPFQALLVDQGLPDGSGLELARELRGSGVATPVLLLSTDRNARAEAYRIGLIFLEKPFSHLLLLAQVRQALT